MRVVLINTGTELLLGDVRDAHLAFIARQIFPLGLRIDEQRTVPDGAAIHDALMQALSSADIVFVTGGLGPTTDDITREIVAELLGLELVLDQQVLAAITERLSKRRIRMTDRIPRQAQVPAGAKSFAERERHCARALLARQNQSDASVATRFPVARPATRASTDIPRIGHVDLAGDRANSERD